MNKKIVISLFVLGLSNVALALDQPPAPILNGSDIAFDRVELVEHFTPGTAELLPQHNVDVVVSGMFQPFCSGLESLVKLENVNSLRDFNYHVIGATTPIRCFAIGQPVRKTFRLDSISLSQSERVPSVVVNGVRGLIGRDE